MYICIGGKARWFGSRIVNHNQQGNEKSKNIKRVVVLSPSICGGANAFLIRQKILPCSGFNQKVEKITRWRCIK